MKKDKCICNQTFTNNCMKTFEKIIVHIAWCPESFKFKEYIALPWYKKLFEENPLKY